jgi:hypothetical protein
MKTPVKNKPRLGTSLLIALALSAGQNALAQQHAYRQHNLVADTAGNADFTDPNLVNPWGVAFNPFGPAWVANEGSGVATLYNGNGNPFSKVVRIPSASEPSGGHPTGIVFNGSSDFVISSGDASAPSRFIFATEDGVIAGWAPGVDPTHAIRVVGGSEPDSESNSENGTSTNGSTSDNMPVYPMGGSSWAGFAPDDTTNHDDTPPHDAVYKGLAITTSSSGSRLYAADFRNNEIDVFDGSFNRATLDSSAFVDPDLPEGFAPFGIQAINGSIYVAYAKQDENKQDDVKGEGLGYISAFTPNGEFIKRVISQGELNAPWGMALAPAGFGEFGSHLLVGNFGDGTINAYDLATGEFAGRLTDTNGNPIQIDGLWALAFGNGYRNQPLNTLFFSAGPNDEQNGLYGRIDVQSSGDDNGNNGAAGDNGKSGSKFQPTFPRDGFKKDDHRSGSVVHDLNDDKGRKTDQQDSKKVSDDKGRKTEDHGKKTGQGPKKASDDKKQTKQDKSDRKDLKKTAKKSDQDDSDRD